MREDTQICYLTEVETIWSGMLEDVLKQHGIPAMKESTIGAGMAIKTGTMFERIRFFVRREDFLKAKELAEELFSASEADFEDFTEEEEEAR